MNIETLFKIAVFTPGPRGLWGLPIFWWGDPGVAKTSLLEALALKYGFAFIPIIGSVREPQDFIGMPIIGKRKDGTPVCTFAPPDWAVAAQEVKYVIVLFDEATGIPAAVQNGLLRVFWERVVGDTPLPPTTRLIAAGNAVEDTAGGVDMNTAFANRMGHMAWRAPSVEAWCEWMSSQTGLEETPVASYRPEEVEADVLARWPGPWAESTALVTSFVSARPDLLHKKPAAFDPAASKAWPSRRSVEMATRALAGSMVHRATPTETEAIFEAFVGPGFASEFMVWRAKQDLPDAGKLLDKQITFTHEPNRLDRTMAVLNACSTLVLNQQTEKRDARALALWELMADVNVGIDVVIPPAKRLAKAGLLKFGKAESALLKKLLPILTAAGIKPLSS